MRTCCGCATRRPQHELVPLHAAATGVLAVGRAEGRGAYVCPTAFMCDSPMDCPNGQSDDPCSTGPWECVRGFCAREYTTCSAPAPMD